MYLFLLYLIYKLYKEIAILKNEKIKAVREGSLFAINILNFKK